MNLGTEEQRRGEEVIENEAVRGNSPSRKKRLRWTAQRLRAGFAWAWRRTYRSAEREMTMMGEGCRLSKVMEREQLTKIMYKGQSMGVDNSLRKIFW